MKLTFRIVSLLAWTCVLLASAGIAAWEIIQSPWAPLAAVLVTALVIAKIVDEVLGVGVFFGRRQAEREAEVDNDSTQTLPPEMHAAVAQALGKFGLRAVSAHRMSEPDEDDESDLSNDLLLQTVKEIKDPDMREFAFHFAHIANGCPGSQIHAKRMEELIVYIDARLRASTVAPQNDDDRPQIH